MCAQTRVIPPRSAVSRKYRSWDDSMQEFQAFIESWGYLGVFAGILLTGLGFPMPEELPIVAGGAMVSSGQVTWYKMLPVCIVGVIIGDSFLYLIGRFWGSKLVQIPFVRDKLLPPDRYVSIAQNFQKYGVKILLFARLTPGIRAPIFLAAGITKLPILFFLIADGIYAIPGVSILFFLGYWFTDTIIDLVNEESKYKPIIALVALAGIGIYVAYRFWRRPVVTGNPSEMPPIVGQVTNTSYNVAENVAEKVAEKVLHRPHPHPSVQETPASSTENNGAPHPNEEKAPARDRDGAAG